MLHMKKRILIIATMCLSTSAFAGGYRVALQGQKALGMGHTGVAMTDSSEVVFFNPAGMSFLDTDTDIIAGITLIDSEGKYQNRDTGATSQTDNPLGTPVGIYYAKKHDDKISYGLGVYTPYGNTVEWEKDWAGSHLVNNIELKAIYIQPTISYKVSDKYSVGFGLNYVSGQVKFNRNISTSLVNASGDRSNVTIEDSGVDAWGYNVGFLANASKEISVGISYRSQVDMEARGGSANFENMPSSMQTLFADTTFNADLVLPAELTLGTTYQISPDLVLAFDINRTYWGAYDALTVQFNNAAGTSNNPRNYKDANVFRFGAQQQYNDKLVLRGGFYFDKSPIGDGYFAPETPRNDSTGLTAGASYEMSNNLELDFSFLYLMFDELNGSYDHYDQSGSTISFGGDYTSTVTTIGFGLNYKF
jgi:long-chain fatty acid transport protein